MYDTKTFDKTRPTVTERHAPRPEDVCDICHREWCEIDGDVTLRANWDTSDGDGFHVCDECWDKGIDASALTSQKGDIAP